MALSQTSWRAPAGWFAANRRNRTMPSEHRSRRVGGAAPASGPGGTQTGLRPEPPAPACGDPAAPRRCRRGALCAASFRRGCAPNPRRPLAGTPLPRAAAAEARCAQLHSDGAAPRTPGARLRGPRCPAPLPPRRAVRSFIQTGLRPEPPAPACGDPAAPRRCRRGALCAASFRRGCAPNPRRPLAGTPLPRAAAAEARCAQLHSDGAAPRTPGARLRGPRCPAPLPPRRAVRSFIQTGLRPEPPAPACGDPAAPRRCRRGALCAPCGVCAGLVAGSCPDFGPL